MTRHPGHVLSMTEPCTCLACGGTDPVTPDPAPDPWAGVA